MSKVNRTTMMDQYLSIKANYPDDLLFFRMGDFYELFFDDACEAAELLDITLTSRGKKSGQSVPMCGVPYHSVDSHLHKLISLGKTVAICEQVGTTAEKYGPVERKVVRVITPGTLIEDSLVEHEQESLLMAINPNDRPNQSAGLAWINLSTGNFTIAQAKESAELQTFIDQVQPTEIIVPERANFTSDEHKIREVDPLQFDELLGDQLLKTHFDIGDLRAFGFNDDPKLVGAAAAALQYVKRAAQQSLEFIQSIQEYSNNRILQMDTQTRRNLEIDSQLSSASYGNTLFDVVNFTVTAMGARLLRQWLNVPSTDSTVIGSRLDLVSGIQAHNLTQDIADTLRPVKDLHRIVSRLAMRNATPRDLIRIGEAIHAFYQVQKQITNLNLGEEEKRFASVTDLSHVRELIERAIVSNPPVTIRDGGVIAEGYHAEIDELRKLRTNESELLQEIEKREQQRTGIDKLKVGFNRVHGYYLEASRLKAEEIPEDYVRRQTLKHTERYITTELKEFEERILSAETELLSLEKSLYVELVDELAQSVPELRQVADVLSRLDVLNGFAQAAVQHNLVRPEFAERHVLHIEDGRHPIVAAKLKHQFVPNSISFDNTKRMLIVTGPNMGGKSTYMRQTALIVLLAYTGCFVPAKNATVGRIDRIFTRIGAADDLAGGRSTFMVEMSETANILHNATYSSLVLLDEIGRGTSTLDGLALAIAIARAMVKLQSLTLFSTHYLELTTIADELPGVKNVHLSATEHNRKVVFLHSVKDGPASQSYGIQVAKLAGVPGNVLQNAKNHLRRLEQMTVRSNTEHSTDLFDNDVTQEPYSHPAIDLLGEAQVDELSPRAALDLVYQLVELVKQEDRHQN